MQIQGHSYAYRIDQQDVITGVCCNWRSFAFANDWRHEAGPERIVGDPLWKYIQGKETRHVYSELFSRVRKGLQVKSIPFRCDSPDERRFLQLDLVYLSDGCIEVRSKIIRKEKREHLDLIDINVPRSGERFVTICSMCKKLAVSEDNWLEIEEALAHLRIFEKEEMPGLTHGFCEDCYQDTMRLLKQSQ
jgi:hypothetical protein